MWDIINFYKEGMKSMIIIYIYSTSSLAIVTQEYQQGSADRHHFRIQDFRMSSVEDSESG